MITEDLNLFLSNLFIINIAIPTIIKVAAYIIMLNFQSPATKLSPANVDDITDGNLANVEISINLSGFRGSNPAIYTSKSFGVPGIKNNINIIHSIFLGFWNNLLCSILSILSLLQKLYTNFLPHFLTAKNTIVVIINTDNVININPPIPP